MSMTLGNLPFARFVMQVSTGAPRIKSNWQAMQAEMLEALKTPVWRAASNVPASLVDHDFTAASHFNDGYDAFKMTGNYDADAMTEVGYAGMVAYRFTLPADYVSGSANITSFSVPVYRDRFCKGGVHVSVVFDGESPSFITWDRVRGVGTAVTPKSAVMAQSDEAAPYLTASSAADDVVEFAISPIANKSRYLWMVLSLEDYEDGWERYNKTEKRLYAIEGSARLAGELFTVTFDADVTPDGSTPTEAVVYRAYEKRFMLDTTGAVTTDFASSISSGNLRTMFSAPADAVSYARQVAITTHNPHYTGSGGLLVQGYVAALEKAYVRFAQGEGIVNEVKLPSVSSPIDGAIIRPFARIRYSCDSLVPDLSVVLESHPRALPFMVPLWLDAGAIELKWNAGIDVSGSGIISRVSAGYYNVWLARGTYCPVVTQAQAANFGLYAQESASGYEFLGRIGYDDLDVSGSESQEKAFRFELPSRLLRGTVNSLLIFPFISRSIVDGLSSYSVDDADLWGGMPYSGASGNDVESIFTVTLVG